MIDTNDDELLGRYLLGDVDETSRESVERRLLVDADFFERLNGLEQVLISDYLSQDLHRRERELFERQLAVDPELRRKVSDARALGRKLAAAGELSAVSPVRSWIGTLALGLAASAVIAVVWLAGENWRMKEEQRLILARVNEKPGASALPATVFSEVALSPETLMGEAKQRRVLIRSETTALRLKLQTTHKFEGYRAIVRDAEGREVWSGTAAIPQFDVPSASLIDGEYIVRLESTTARGGYEAVADYSFAVTRR